MVGNTKKGEHGYDEAYEHYQYYDDGDVHVWHVHDFLRLSFRCALHFKSKPLCRLIWAE